MKINYKNLKNFIYKNPKIVNINRFCLEIGYKPQHFRYYYDNGIVMPKDMIDKIVKTYNIKDSDIDSLFYLVKSYK